MEQAQRTTAIPCLLCRIQTRLCALPIEWVEETLRPLPMEPVSNHAPACVRGMSVIRGAPLPVVDAARLFDGGETVAGRFVTLKVGARRVALAVDSVQGVASLAPGSLQGLPPLLQDAGAGPVEAIGLLDNELLLVLRSARLVPEREGLPA